MMSREGVQRRVCLVKSAFRFRSFQRYLLLKSMADSRIFVSLLTLALGISLFFNINVETIYVKVKTWQSLDRSEGAPLVNLSSFLDVTMPRYTNYDFVKFEAIQILGTSHADRGGPLRHVTMQQTSRTECYPQAAIACTYEANIFRGTYTGGATLTDLNATDTDFITIYRVRFYHVWINLTTVYFYEPYKEYGCGSMETVVYARNNGTQTLWTGVLLKRTES